MTTMSQANPAAAKAPTTRRELTLYDLVVPDLQQFEASGKFDRNVLLWLQDAYVSRAMKENTGELLKFHRQLAQESMSDDERMARKREFLGKITKETYSAIKGAGGGIDLKQYVDAAKTFYGVESTLYAGQLREVAEYIQKSLANGVKPDLERFARESFVSMARMSGAIKNLEGLGARANAHQVAQMMRQGIQTIHYTTVTTASNQSLDVGRQLLKLVDQISQVPEKYLQFVDPRKMGAPRAGPWDFETERRGANPDGQSLAEIGW